MLELSAVCNNDPLFVVCCGQVHVDFGDGLQTLQRHVRQHVGLNATQKHVVFHLVSLLLVTFVLVIITCTQNS